MPRRSNRAYYREAKGLPATLRPGRPVVALCTWERFNYSADDREETGRYWLPDDDEPATACRASLGDEKLTVWLPRGARIVLRHGADPAGRTFTHTYGSHERFSRSRIVIRLTELPNLGA